jgi:hypothetical protein
MILPALLLAANAFCADAPAKGYVVRADSDTVWLDLTAADGAAPGRAFEIYAEGPELKHPVTGASLGRVETELATGAVVEVFAQYSTGRLNAHTAAIAAGQRARLAGAPAPVSPAVPAAAMAPSIDEDARPGDAARRTAKSRGAPVGYQIAGMAVGDFDGGGKPQVALASENKIYLYAYPAADGKALAEAEVSGTGVRVLGLEAADAEGAGRAQLFVSLYDSAFRRFETRVFKLDSGKWLKTAEMPFLTRAYQDATGASVLATQQVVDDSSFPFGRIYPLVFKDGRYAQGAEKVPLRRADWLFGFTTARLGGRDATLFTTTTHALRVQFDKGDWRTPDDDFGQTPLRVRWGSGSGDRLLEFPAPNLLTYGADGSAALYAVRNMAALGGLASPFGLFNHGELVRENWDGLGLQSAWRAEFSGCAQGLAVVETAPGRREILVAVRGSADQSAVWVYDP